MTGPLPAGDLRLPVPLTASEAAVILTRALGTRVSVARVRRLAAEGALERVNLGRRMRVTPGSVAAYVQLQAAGASASSPGERAEDEAVAQA